MKMIVKRGGVDTRRIVEEFDEVAEIQAAEIRARAAGLTFWTRLADRNTEKREVVVLGLNPENEDWVSGVLTGFSAAIPVPARDLRFLPGVRNITAKPEWADTDPNTGSRQLELALLSHYDPENPRTRLIHLYLYHLSVAHANAGIQMSPEQCIEWLIGNWEMGDEAILYTPEPLLAAGYRSKKSASGPGSPQRRVSQTTFAGVRAAIVRDLGGR